MKINRLFFFFALTGMFIEQAMSQVIWPLAPQSQQHPVVGSMGEYRNTNRFHKGTDVSGTGNVKAINSGTVTGFSDLGTSNSTVWVGNIAYIHVIPNVGFGNQVIAGQTTLGTVYSNHVHIQQTNFNFLSHGLSPYVDNTPPIINYVEFRQNGAGLYSPTALHANIVTLNSVDYTMLFDKVDIIADAEDPGDNNSRLAPINLSYHLFNSAGNPIGDWVTSFNFRNTPDNSRTSNCFYSGTIQTGVFKYILTSSPNTGAAERYFHTRINKINMPQTSWPNNNSLAAPCNSESYYSDGIYSMSITLLPREQCH